VFWGTHCHTAREARRRSSEARKNAHRARERMALLPNRGRPTRPWL